MGHTEEKPLARTAVHKVLVWDSQDLHDARQLLLLILAGKYGEPSVKFGQDTAQAPHVDSHMIIHAEYDFRRTVEPALNVGVY